MASEAINSLHLLLFLLLWRAASAHIVKTLPGYAGDLPFKLETGYTSVGDVEFFYYFVESEGNPAADPLLLYLQGGPGCSGLNGLFYQIGPLKFDIANYTSGLPTLIYEPNTWTKNANIIFLDSPVGSGFSYATTTDGWNTTDIKAANQVHSFLRNWLSEHPDFQTNPVFLGSDSWAGIIVPIIALDIINGNVAGLEPIINLKGLSLGCPHTDSIIEFNEKIPLAHHLALISDEMYEAAKSSCNGSYYAVDETNTECIEALDAITECTKLLSTQSTLDPNCAMLLPGADEQKNHGVNDRANPMKFLLQSPVTHDFYCHNFDYLLSDIWTNYKTVQAALHVRPGTVKQFYRCNISLSYTTNMNSVVPFHQNLTNTGLQVLVFSGDHDMVIPHNGVEKWINSLDLTTDIDWRPWFVEGQVAGYTTRYTNSGYRLTYATIKGAGHSPQEYKRKECQNMFHRWIHYYPI